jgi:hypothetical protein
VFPDTNSISTLKMEMELDSETMDFVIHLTQLSAQEVFIKFCCPENIQDIHSADTVASVFYG